MSIVTRRFVREPSNSKCAGATRHLSIQSDGGESKSFAVSVEQRGTGMSSVEVPNGPATVEIGGTFAVGSGARKRTQRLSTKVAILVTGVDSDTCVVMLDAAQPIEVALTCCVLAS
jgi:hypothetical protein